MIGASAATTAATFAPMSMPSVPAFWYGLPEASVSPSTFVPALPPVKSTNPTSPQSSGQQVAMTLPLVWHPDAGLLNEVMPAGQAGEELTYWNVSPTLTTP